MRFAGLLLVAGTALGLTSWPDTERLLRRGNEAYLRGDLGKAADFFCQAEDRTTDPGLVAFNEAAAFYLQGRYREAELHYRRCLEDAEGTRRTQALYGLANAVLQLARERARNRFAEARALYRECINLDGTGDDVTAAAAHNVELAKLLQHIPASTKAAAQQGDSEQQVEERPDRTVQNEGRDPGEMRSEQRQERSRVKPDVGEDAPIASDQPPPPGKGNLPPIPDADQLAPLPAEDAAEYLRQATERIEREKQTYRRRNIPPASSGVKDW